MKKTILFVAILLVGFMGFGQNSSYIIKLKMQNDSVCFNTQNVSSIRIDAFGHELIHDDRTYWTALEDLDTVYIFRTENVPDWVDLGLPSGLLWAACNLGANYPEDYGDYFAWGEIEPKDLYNWNTYRYCMGSYNTLTKCCNNSYYGYNNFTDSLTILLPEDDAATANIGVGWRIPTTEEWQELLDNCILVWMTQNGVNGMRCTGSNGNSIFLPAAGYHHHHLLIYPGSCGLYWSSSLYTSSPPFAYLLNFYSTDYSTNFSMDYYNRAEFGQSIRAVHSVAQ